MLIAHLEIHRTPRRILSQLKNAHFELYPEEICLRQWNSVTRLFSKMAARGEKCRSFEAIASPQSVVPPLS
jgi:hypothetical protein